MLSDHVNIGELSKIKELGTITVQCVHEPVGGEYTMTVSTKTDNAGAPSIILEKALKDKAISHSIG